MIVEERTYTALPGKAKEWLAYYEEHAFPIQQKYLGRCLGWYTTVEGPLNRVVHMWGYENQGDREARRNAMAADPAWGTYLKKAAELGLLDSMENRILKPTDFSPVQ